MENLFLQTLNLSISALWLTLGVLAVRLLLSKAPKRVRLWLWALVGLRLVCPISLESGLSLLPSAQTIPEDILYTHTPTINSGIPIVNNAVNPALQGSLTPEVTASVNPMQIVAYVASLIWIFGMVTMAVYALLSYIRLRRKVREAIPGEQGLWLCDHIPSPFILGILRPKIYLPSDIAQGDLPYVLAHEQAHLQRRDHWWKPLGFVLLGIHWFNPLLWVAYGLFCKDLELACDERVLNTLGTEAKKPYAQALLRCSVPRRGTVCPLAFGEGSVKGRIRSVLSYKKPHFWVLLVAVVACIALAVGFFTKPVTQPEETKPTESVKDNFPELFDSSKEPLTVYVWQMSKGSYQCKAVKTATDRYTDHSFAFTGGISIPEMRKWLASHGATEETVTLQPVQNPLSSYLYTIDDVYRANLRTLFWGEATEVSDIVLTYAGWTKDSEIYYGGLNADTLYIDSVRHLPIYKCDTVKDLAAFSQRFGNTLSLDSSWDEVPSFQQATAKFDEAFFQKNTLLLVYIEANNSTHRFTVDRILRNDTALCVTIKETTQAEATDLAMSGWLLTIAIKDSLIAECTTFDAIG